MIPKEIINLDDLNWEKIRSNFTSAVYGKQLMNEDWSKIKITYTKVEPNGEFPIHVDNYHHIFLFLEGSGEGYFENETYKIIPNLVVKISAGVKHGYKNTSYKDLLLLTINIPKKE
ncbi:MAG: cupin domain-containing protein [Asgard group archaeon]|nr:cupin domain-containing protein [Asgard group archaeon]